MGKRALFVSLVATGLVLLIIISVFSRDNIYRHVNDPRQPFLLANQPSAPDYQSDTYWIRYPPTTQGPDTAEIFFLAGSAVDGGYWTVDADAARVRDALVTSLLPNHAGAFRPFGTLHSPLYRQATIFTQLTHRLDARRARALALEDVEAAFRVFLNTIPADSPIILAGHEQGALLLQGMLRSTSLRSVSKDRVIAIYLWGQTIPIDALVPNPTDLPLCKQPEDFACIVAWNAASWRMDRLEVRRQLDRAMVFDDDLRLVPTKDRDAACLNPVTGSSVQTSSSVHMHRGGVEATGFAWTDDPPLIQAQVSAECHDGLLRYSPPDAPQLRRQAFWGGRFRPRTYSLFFGDIREDVRRRMASWQSNRASAPEASSSNAPPDREP